MELLVPRYEDYYALRLSYSNDEIPAHFWHGLLNLCEGHLAVEHDDTDTKHIHMAIANSRYTHDRLRKELVKLVKETITDNPPKGNALMSLKKWDGADTYLVYMFKGNRYNTVSNFRVSRGYDAARMWISAAYIEELRSKWKENMSKSANYWSEFKKSVFYPPPTEKRTYEQEMAATEPPAKVPFDTIKMKAIEFAMAYLKVTAIDAKVRYIAKDLISNYCLFNSIKMGPIYI